MNYSGKKIAITGAGGFIGTALLQRLMADYQIVYSGSKEAVLAGSKYVIVKILNGDIRDPETFYELDYTYDYLFHFAAPSSQVLFQRQPLYSAEVTLTGFINAARACEENGIRLIYPSTGLISSPQRNEYARCKEICEDMVKGNSIDSLGLRIFATYGPGEGHKRDYASVPYLFARDMVAGKAPMIYGDGEQVRDFIYIDDVVQAILHLAEECPDKVIDVGSGKQTSFNTIVAEINGMNDLPEIKPVYIKKPSGYIKETLADPTRLHEFYKRKTTLAAGISKLVKDLKASQNGR